MARRNFLDAVYFGRNQPWRYALGIAVVLATWLLGSVLASAAIAASHALGLVPAAAYQDLLAAGLTTEVSLAIFIATNLVFVLALLALAAVVRQLHGRSLRSLVAPQPPLRWRRIATGFGLWLLLLNAATIASYFLAPEAYDDNFQLAQWLPFTLVALVLTPLQTSAEELFFRGYLLQALGLVTRQRGLLLGLASASFMLPHLGNPEMGRHGGLMALSYLTLGAFLTLITLVDNGLELALGVHAANNLSVVAIANTRDSALPSPAIWLSDSGDPAWGLVILLAMSAIFYLLAIGRDRRPARPLD